MHFSTASLIVGSRSTDKKKLFLGGSNFPLVWPPVSNDELHCSRHLQPHTIKHTTRPKEAKQSFKLAHRVCLRTGQVARRVRLLSLLRLFLILLLSQYPQLLGEVTIQLATSVRDQTDNCKQLRS